MSDKLTAQDVLTRALELSKQGHFDCPHCACAKAKQQLDYERGTGVDLCTALRNMFNTLPSDRPLVDAANALRPYLSEIVECPSPLSDARMQEILDQARLSVVN